MNKAVVNDSGDRFLVLKLNVIDLFVPQNEVVVLDNKQQLNFSESRQDAIGVINYNNHDVMCFYLDDELDIKNRVPDDCVTSVILEKDNYRIALMCKEVVQLEYTGLNYQEIPDCMSVKRSPLTRFCVYQKHDDKLNLGMMTDAASLVNYVGI